MKKKIFVALMAVAVGLGMLTGCSKDKPYSSYNIGVDFYGLPKHENGCNYTEEEASKLSADQRDLYFVANYLAGWLTTTRLRITCTRTKSKGWTKPTWKRCSPMRRNFRATTNWR